MTNPEAERKPSAKARLYGGAAAGMIAGAAMAMVAMIRAAAVGLGFWLPPKQIAGVIYGVDALIGGGSAVALGLLIHMVMSAAAGILFALVAYRLSTMTSLLVGMVYGVLVWAVMTWLALPLVNQVMLDRVMVMPNWWFVYHLIFGGMLIVVPGLVNAFSPVGTRSAAGARGSAQTIPS